jgi:hypothetical protein
MTSRTPLIVWEKWIDPLGLDNEEDIEDNPFFDDENEEDTQDAEHGHDPMEMLDQHLIKKTKNVRVISTPMGIIPMEEMLASGKIFNFWVGYTNFSITKNIAYILEKTDGVETLDIFTRYRFRVGVGKLFEDGEVMRNINAKVYEYLL